MKDEQLNARVCRRSFGCATNSWCKVVIKMTSGEVNGTMQLKLVNVSPISQAYTNLVVSASTPMCERGFSKPNLSKNQLQASIAFEMLDALMRISMVDIVIYEIDWDNVILCYI
jgi:hypothetical protein